MLDDLKDAPALKRVEESLRRRFGAALLAASFEKGELQFEAARETLSGVLEFLKTGLGFESLTDMIGLDLVASRPEGAGRFAVLYQLYKFPEALRVRLRVAVDDGEALPSVTPLFRAADWMEREVFDMFGIRFEGHPGLTRIYLPDEFEGFPLRKDFPLEGRERGL